ncbi:GMC family oxidoreductase [bacterium]|nr:GMC family oxidoreductase [bacterium]
MGGALNQNFDFDYVVVGSGFGGSVSALRLTEKGYRTLILECGRRFEDGEFPKTNWNVRKYLWAPMLKCFGILRLSLFSDVFILSGSGVGGGSLVYANTLYVPPDDVFRSANWPDGRDWLAEMRPFYRTAQAMLGVTQNRFEGPADAALRAVADEMGVGDTYIRTPVGVYFGEPNRTVSDPFFGGAGPDRTGCNFCGGCMTGCRFGAKNTLRKNYLHFAEKLGCRILDRRTVTDIRPLEDGGYAIHHERTGAWFLKDRRVTRAGGVVLSAGVLGTMRLLLRCKERGSLPNLSDRLGDEVRTNSESILSVTETGDVNHSHGIAITSSIYPDEHTHVEVVRYSKGSDLLAGITTVMPEGDGDGPRFRSWARAVMKRPGAFLRMLIPFGWARRTTILLVMQTIDSSMRFVLRRRWFNLFGRSLDTDIGDGPPIPSYIPIGNEVTRRFAARRNGVARTSVTQAAFGTPITAHILGGAAMGATARTGVISDKNEVFGYPNMFVCDGSAVPANLGVNPSLTITAIAERAMSFIPARAHARPAIDPAWMQTRVRDIENEIARTGSRNMQSRG